MGIPTEFVEHLNPTVLLIIAVAFAVLTFSERLANLQGKFRWIGGLARWWSLRQVRKVRRDNLLERTRRRARDDAYASLEDRYHALNEQVTREVEELRQQMRRQSDSFDDELEAARLEHREEIRKLREEHQSELQSMRGQIVALLQWGHAQRTKAAQSGIELDPMPPSTT